MRGRGVEVRARVDAETKLRAEAALAEVQLSIPEAIRLMLRRVAEEGRMPFEVRVAGRETWGAMAELCAGQGARFESVDSLMKDLRRYR